MKYNLSRTIVITVVISMFLITGIISGCVKQGSDRNEEKLYSFIIPKPLLGGRTAEQVVESFDDPEATVLKLSGEEVLEKEIFTDEKANDDGTVTYVFTKSQLEAYKQIVYDAGSLQVAIKQGATQSIRRTEFTKEDLTEIVVYVDKDTYDNYGMDGIIVNMYATTYMGIYQILNGTDPSKWHVHIIVRDEKTGELVVEASYPNG